MRELWLMTARGGIVVALATVLAACGSSVVTAPPNGASAPAGSTPTAPVGSSPGPGIAHTSAIEACGLLDEPTLSSLVGFQAKFFGPTDPVARVPPADRTFINTNGAALRIAPCGYWETGVKPELSRDVTIEVIQGDPAKPGTWSADAAHAQFGILQTSAAAKQPQAVATLGDEAFSATSNGSVIVTVRSGDLVVQIEADSPPDSSVLTVNAVGMVAQAVLGKL